MDYHWNWLVFLDPVALGSGRYFDWLLSGAAVTLTVGLAAWSLALVIGLPLGTLQTARSPWLRATAVAYSEVFRNIPLIVQMFIWYFVLPELLPRSAGYWVKREMPMPEVLTAVVALGVYTAARVAIQMRAGIESIPSGARDAAAALGLSAYATYRLVLVPIALRTSADLLSAVQGHRDTSASGQSTDGVWRTSFVPALLTPFLFGGS